nr:hypothetical protein Iba_chr05cCG17660 [Ipomoea batatas]
MDGNQENSTSIRTIWRAHDCSLPMKHVLSNRTSAAGSRRILLKILELLQDPLGSHANQSCQFPLRSNSNVSTSSVSKHKNVIREIKAGVWFLCNLCSARGIFIEKRKMEKK